MSIPVVADADVLFSATTRGLFIYLDYQGLIALHWSPLILDEVSRALVETGRKKTRAQARENEARMNGALPNAMVATKDVQAQFKAVESAVRSAKDMHVAACAYHLVATNAYPNSAPVTLVSRNIKDFRKDALAKLGIALQKADDFLDALCASHPTEVGAAFQQFRLDIAIQPEPEVLLKRLERDGLVKTAKRLFDL
ncbi:MAG: PIN domain-containing protein [Nevskiaceae bacterium]|nr:PIN domain-containing protein [Nevskiaceae bacterium]